MQLPRESPLVLIPGSESRAWKAGGHQKSERGPGGDRPVTNH